MSREKWMFWAVVAIGLSVLVLQDISSTIARKENRLVNSILIDRQNEPAPMENSVVGICQSTDPVLPDPEPLDADLSTAQVDALTRAAVQRAGGIADVIQPGDWVVIKPNILRYYGQGGYSLGVATDLRVVRSVIQQLVEEGDASRITVAEGKQWRTEDGGWQVAWPEYGNLSYAGMIADLQAQYPNKTIDYVDLDYPPYTQNVPVPGGGVSQESYTMPDAILNCDRLIAVAVMKTHTWSRVTLANKLYIGATPASFYNTGQYGGSWDHGGLPHGPLDRTISDLVSYHPADFSIVEGIWGIQGNGPAGSGAIRRNVVLASKDIVAVDAVSSAAMGFNPWDIDYLHFVHNKGFGTYDLDYVTVNGPSIQNIRYDFAKPRRDDPDPGYAYGSYVGRCNRTWLLNGFHDEYGSDLGYDYLGGEATASPVAGEIAGGETWTEFSGIDDYMDLQTYFGGSASNCITYAFTRILADEGMTVNLRFGSDDGIKIWLNGSLVYTAAETGTWSIIQQTVPVTLVEGQNRLLVKIKNTSGPYGFSMAVSESDGDTPFGIRYSLTPTAAPEVVLTSPMNGTETLNSFMNLDATVTDPDGDDLTVRFYGGRNNPNPTDLIGMVDSVASGSAVSYNWNAPLMPVDSNTVALWHYDEYSGDMAYDAGPDEYDGEVVQAKWVSRGKFGPCLYFDGLGNVNPAEEDYVLAPDTSLSTGRSRMDKMPEITLEAWIYVASPLDEPYYAIFKKWGPNTNPELWSYAMVVMQDRRLYWHLITDRSNPWGTYGVTVITQTLIPLYQWVHVCGTYDGSMVRLYINGVPDPVAALPYADSVQDTPVGTHVGAAPYLNAQYFHGFIDEPRIMDRALTAEEIAARVRLADGRYYWKVEVSDGTNVVQSEVRYFDIGDVLPPDPTPPEVTLNSPPNGYNTTNNNVQLSADVSDENPMTVRFYGNSTDASDLLYARENVSSGTVTYTWTNPMPMADASTRSLWHLSEGEGTRTYDKTAYDNDGQLYGGVAWTTDARFGYALDFDGVDDYVEVVDNGSVPLSGPMTVEAWIKPSGDPIQYSEIVDREPAGAGGGYSFLLNNDRRIHLWVGDGTDWTNSVGTTQLQDNVWYYVVGVADGSAIRVYVNGVQEGTPTAQGAPTNPSLVNLRIGRGCGALLRWFNGIIDEVRISNRALTPEEIAANYATGLPQGTYFWNVAANDGQNNTTSGTWNFYIGAGAGPLIPTLISPADLAVIVDNTPTFTWSATAGQGGTYTLQYARDAGFTTGVVTVSALASASYTVPDPEALGNGTYYWHVQAFDAQNNSRGYQATPFSFQVASPSPPAIVLESPPNGDVTMNPYMNLDFTVTDPGETMTLWVYGDMTDASALLYVAENVASPADMTYVWNALTLAVDGNTSALWRFDEGTGTAAADETTNNNDGTVSGATWTSGGRFGYGLDFDGVNDYVQVPASASLNITGPITIEAWIRPSGAPLAYSEIVDKEGSWGYSFILNNDRRLHFWIGDGTDWTNSVGTTQLQDNIWYYVVGVADGSAIRVYVNGAQEGTPTPQGPPGSTAGVNLQIGRGGSSLQRWFNGIIDEVRISNRALTPEEIAANFELGDGRYYWKVVASDGTSSSTSETRYFNIGEPAGPPIPELLSPPDLAVLNDNTPTFTWSATAGVGGTYTLQYARDAGFTDVVGTVSGLTDATFTIPGTLADDTYYWHVEAFDAGNETRGYQATPFSFTIDTSPPAIELVAPPDLATTMDPFMDLVFTVSDAADALTVWVYGDRDDASELLYVREGVPGSSMTYSWTGRPHQLDAAAVGLWHFNEGAGISVSDATGNGNDGSLVNGAAWTDDGRFGYAVQFDGVDDAVVVPDAPELDGMSELTVEAWINLAVDPTDWMAVVQKWAPQGSPNNQYTYTMVVSATNRLYAHIFTDAGDALLTGDLEIPLNTWAHVATTYDGSVVRLYVNGVQDPVTRNLTGTINSTNREVNIGACLPYDSEYFNGMIDDVRILTRALTPEEIAADATSQLPLGAYYWRVAASDGANTSASATRRFDIVEDTVPPVVTLNYPANNATTTDRFMELSATATDLSLMTVRIYGDRVDGSTLLYAVDNMASPADVTYVWNALVPTVDANTAALWHFSEGTGAAASDETANNNDGTISGATWTSDGRFGYGLDFDGVNDYVQVPASASLNITGPITIEAWIRPSGNPVEYSEIVDKETLTPGPGYSFILNNTRLLQLWVGESATDWTNAQGTTALQDGVWYYVVGVADGSNIRVYVNGVQEGPAVPQGPPGSTAGANLQIGRGGSALQRWFNGIIDEVRISNRALTPEEIAANFELGDGRYYWKVVASHGSYSTTSETRTFTIGLPPVPTLISPPDLALITDNTPTFTWSATAGAGGTYTLQYALDAGFTSGLVTRSGLTTATYTVPDLEALADNTYYWHVQAVDQWLNPSGYQATPYSFTLNALAPGQPTDFAVLPGHQKCKLSWSNPSDPDFAGVMIRRNPWGVGAYPEYDSAPVGYPASRTEGIEVYVGMAQSRRDSSGTDTMPRNVYYYTIFSFDAAGNYSAASSAVQGRATNYWLGDINGDGSVDMSDFVPFSTAFGTIQSGQGWNPYCDFGPSETGLGASVPIPDDVIDFEDLMIIALNYGVVGPVMLPPSIAGGRTEELGDLVAFGVTPDEAGVISVMLENRASTLKGFRLVVEVGDGCEIAGVTRGSQLDDMGNVFFGTIPRSNRSVDICAAALGTDAPLHGDGEIARIRVNNGENAVIRVAFKEIDVRDLANRKHEFTVEEYQGPFIPAMAGLMQNYPNPFNPVTTITYDVAATGRVTIEVFDVSGRLIKTVVDEKKAPGRYKVDWQADDQTGASVSSGIYFYRMTTESGVMTRKMVLLR